jgi:general secretion pathway protein D
MKTFTFGEKRACAAATAFPSIRLSSLFCLAVWSFFGIWDLGFGIFSASAQVPNAPQSAVPLPPPAPIAIRSNAFAAPPATTGAGGVGDTSPSTRTAPRTITPPRSNSIVNASPASTNIAGAGQFTVINPAAKPTNAAPEEIVQPGIIDFRKMDIDNVLNFYADLVNRTILRAANLPNPQIVLTTKTPLTKSEAKQALDSVLYLNGIAMIDFGDKFVKAMPLQTAPNAGEEFHVGSIDTFSALGQYVTHVVQLNYLKPSEVIQVLQPFASSPNPPLAIDSSQILIIRDLSENVKRMLELLREIDVSVPSEFVSEVIPIKYAKASEIASAINSLSSGGGGATVGGGGASRSASGTRSTSSFGGSSRGFGQSGTGAGYQGGFGQPGGGYNPGVTPQATTAPGGATGNTFTDRLRNLVNRASQTGEIVVLNQTKMIADERTNSLLIYASREDMRTIKDIIGKLDVVLAQVLIEAVIIEVTLNDSRDVGVSYAEKQAHGIGSYFNGIGAINNGTALSLNNFISGTASNAASSLPGGLSYLGSFGGDLDVAVNLVASDSRARILQRPRIQTSHNEQAQLFVGESRPYPSASYYGGGAFGGYSSIQAVNIGVTLEVTPLINPDGLVVMDIHQTIESANGTVTIANVGDVPITSRKEAAAKVSVRDHDTIILGGLIETSKTRSGSGVPFLKDVPILGYLFRSTSDKEVRNELVVLIRPTVLPTPEVAALTARAEKDRMPGVRRFEGEVKSEEGRRLKKADRDFQLEKETDK